ncbi:hypothetical protein ACSBR1_028250 [Camellia fascicularis]
MKGPKATSIAHKKIDSEMVKKRKADASAKKEKASKKNSGAPKRPSSAFFVFMEEFRKSFKENFPDNKSVSIRKRRKITEIEMQYLNVFYFLVLKVL